MRNYIRTCKPMTWIWPALAILGMTFSGCATAPRPKESPKAGISSSPASSASLILPVSPVSPASPASPKSNAAALPQAFLPQAGLPQSATVSPGDTPEVSPSTRQQPKEHENGQENGQKADKSQEEDKGQARGAAKRQTMTPLTLAECIKIALEQNPVNRAVREGVIAAREAEGEATAPYYPELALSAGYSRWQKYAFLPNGLSSPGSPPPTIIGPTDDWTTGLRARLLLFDCGERGAHRTAVMARHWAAEEDEENVHQDIVLQVHQAYYGLRSAHEARSIAGKSLLRADDHLRLATEKKDAGAVPKVDVVRTQAEVAQAKLALVRAESLIRIAKGKLNVVMGSPVDTWIEVQGTPVEVKGAPVEGQESPSDQSEAVTPPGEINVYDALDQAIKTRPTLKAALLRTAAARREVSAARSTFGPKIRADGGYGWRGPDFFPDDEEWSAGISLDWPIFTGFSGKHKLSRTKAELSKEEAQVQRLVLEVQEEVWSSYSKLQETYEAIQTSEALVQYAQESLRLARERYEAGSGPVSDLLDTQTALDRAEAARLEAQWDYFVAKASFQRAIGKLDGRDQPGGSEKP